MTGPEHPPARPTAPYAVARVTWFVPGGGDDPLRDEAAALPSFTEVERFLGRTYDRFADLMADLRADGEPPSDETVGGLGVRVTNAWGGVTEVGVGRAVWSLCRTEPRPTRRLSDRPEVAGPLVFYLDGWHPTELDRGSLLSREAALRALRVWLDTDRFPADGGAP